MFSTYTDTSQKRIGSNTNFILIPTTISDELFSKSWGEILKDKIRVFEETRKGLDHLTKNNYKQPIGEISLNDKSTLAISLESYTSFEESWNSELNSLNIPVKVVLKYSIPHTDYIIPTSFSKKKDKTGKNLDLENILHYTSVKLPASSYLEFVKSDAYTKFRSEFE